MKIKISSIIILLLTTATINLAQENKPMNQTDDKGFKQGYWEKHYQNGNIQYSGNFKDNKPVGVFKRFDQDGILKVEMLYLENSDKIYSKFYYPGQKLQAEGIYLGKLKDSTWLYYSEEGHKINEITYQYDQKNGTEKKYYQNGNLSEISHWEQDVLDGLTIRYYDSGKVMMRIFYMNGRLDGEYNVYGPDENILIQGQYENNKREGKWIYYKENGHVENELIYTNGIAENQEELERLENEQIEQLEKNKGKFQDPMENMYNSIPPEN